MVQTKKFHLEEGGKNVYVCKKERRLLFSLKISHISVSKIHPTRNVENVSLGCWSGLGSWAPPPPYPHPAPAWRTPGPSGRAAPGCLC